MNKFLLIFALFAQSAFAGLPPPTSKVSGDSANVTTFNYQFPNFTGTHTGTSVSLGVNGIAGGGTNNGSLAVTAGGVIYTDGSKLVNVGAGSSGQFLKSQGASAPVWSSGSYTPVAPTVQTFLSGSGTYTTPTSPAPLYLRVRVLGGGGGGSAAGGSAQNGSAGGTSTFGTSLITANGGGGGTWTTAAGGAGGTASVTTSSTVKQLAAVTGGGGMGLTGAITGSQGVGGIGGSSAFGGGGGTAINVSGYTGATNTGAGGGGGSSPGNSNSGSGGGAGGYAEVIITSPSSTYSYAVGASGNAGGSGTYNGGNGGSGIIIVEEHYQ